MDTNGPTIARGRTTCRRSSRCPSATRSTSSTPSPSAPDGTGFPGVPIDDRPPLSTARARGRHRRRAPVTRRTRGDRRDDPHADRAARLAVRGRPRSRGDLLDPAVPTRRAVVAERLRPRGAARRRDVARSRTWCSSPRATRATSTRGSTDATGWSPAAALRTEVRQITRTAQKIRSLFGALAADVPTTLEDQRVVDAGRAVTYRRSGSAVDGVDLAWITTLDTVWVFPNASDLLGGFGRSSADVTLQATTESELTARRPPVDPPGRGAHLTARSLGRP